MSIFILLFLLNCNLTTFLCVFQYYFRTSWEDHNCWLHSYPKCQWTCRWITAYFCNCLCTQLSYIISESAVVFNVSRFTFSGRFFQLYKEKKKTNSSIPLQNHYCNYFITKKLVVKFTFQYCNSWETQMLCKVVLCYLCFIQSMETGKNPIPTTG